MDEVRVRLVPYRSEEHRELLLSWLNDPETTRWMASGRVHETDDTLWASDPLRSYAFAVVAGMDQFPCGVVGLYGIDWLSRKAELRIVMGLHRGHGVGSASCQFLLDFAFGQLNLHRVWLGTAEGNLPAILCFQKVGFKREGLLEEDLFRDGTWHNNVRMRVMRREWVERRQSS